MKGDRIMATSNLQHRVAVFNALKSRYLQKAKGLSRKALMTACNIDEDEVLEDAFKILEGLGYLRIDIGGNYPAVTLLKDKWKGADQQSVVWPVPAGAPLPVPAQPKHDAVPVKVTTTQVAPAPKPAKPKAEKVAKPDNRVSFLMTPDDIQWLRDQHFSFGEGDEDFSAYCRGIFSQAMNQIRQLADAPVLVLEAKHGPTDRISFTVTDSEYDALCEAMDEHPHSIKLDAFAKLLCLTELNRLLSADAPKHRITGEVMRAAREEGRDLGEFVTDMIAVGMTAREMNRKGF